CPHHHRHGQAELALDQAADLLADGVRGASRRPYDDVAALDIGADVGEAVCLERLAQLRHRDHVAATDVDRSQERDPGRHVRPTPVWLSAPPGLYRPGPMCA